MPNYKKKATTIKHKHVEQFSCAFKNYAFAVSTSKKMPLDSNKLRTLTTTIIHSLKSYLQRINFIYIEVTSYLQTIVLCTFIVFTTAAQEYA